MEKVFRALLLAGFPEMSASRINWGEHPQGEDRPYIVLHLISLVEGHLMQGPDGLQRSRVQVDCYAPGFTEARELAGRVKTILDFHRSGRILGVFFSGLRMMREEGSNHSLGNNSGEALYRASLDFMVNWRADHAG